MEELAQKNTKSFRTYTEVSVTHPHRNDSPHLHDLSLPKSEKKNGLMLDLEVRNGNSMVAATMKKYIPIGIEANFESAKAALSYIKQQKINGYIIVSAKYELPFQSDIFDLVWSFPACAFHRIDEFSSFTEKAHRVLAKSGQIKMAFQTSKENPSAIGADHSANSSVRLYAAVFEKYFSKVYYSIQSCFRSFPTKDNLKNAALIDKPLILFALLISFLSKYSPVLHRLSDSYYLHSRKIKGPQNTRIAHFLRHHWLKQNLNVVYLLQCPISGGPVYLSPDSKFIISDKAGVKYPVIEDIPIMLSRAAIPMEKTSTADSDEMPGTATCKL